MTEIPMDGPIVPKDSSTKEVDVARDELGDFADAPVLTGYPEATPIDPDDEPFAAHPFIGRIPVVNDHIPPPIDGPLF